LFKVGGLWSYLDGYICAVLKLKQVGLKARADSYKLGYMWLLAQGI